MTRLRIIHYRINRTKSLAHARRPFRIAVLSDLHDDALAEEGGLLVRQISRLDPDMIFCCGDMLTAKFGKIRSDRALSFLCALAQRWPVYAVNGNHETRLARCPEAFPAGAFSWFEKLRSAGVKELNNSSELICPGGAQVRLFGYEAEAECYSRTGRKLPDRREIESALGICPREMYTIVLCHHPDCFPALADWGADLVLAGHLHGGMVRLPFAGGLVGGTLIPFPRYDRGRFETDGGSELIVSAGLGDHTIPVRLNNPPELVILE